MSTREKWLWTYKVLRSVLFTTVAFIAFLLAGLYVTLSIPGVQRKVRDVACEQFTLLTGSRIEIGDVGISPFSEVVVKDVNLYQPEDSTRRCLHVEKIGAGISLWNLLANHRIVITYAELIGMDAHIWQARPEEPLNIQFLIDAFSPKDKSKPPAKFDLRIRNIVIRKSAINFSRDWAPANGPGAIDFNHLRLSSLNADVALPRLSNDLVEIDLRRLAFRLNDLLEVKRLSLYATIGHGDISISDFYLSLPNSTITITNQTFPLGTRYGGDFRRMMEESDFSIELNGSQIIPAEFAGLYPPLSELHTPFTIILHASGNAGAITLDDLHLTNVHEDVALEVRDASAVRGDSILSEISVGSVSLHAGETALNSIVKNLLPQMSPRLKDMIAGSKTIDLELSGQGSVEHKVGQADISLSTSYGSIAIGTSVSASGDIVHLRAKADTEGWNLGGLLGLNEFGMVTLNVEGDVDLDRNVIRRRSNTGVESIDRINDLLPQGSVKLDVPLLEINGYPIHGLTLDVEKNPATTAVTFNSADENLRMNLEGQLTPAGAGSELKLGADIDHVYPGAIWPMGGSGEYVYGAGLSMALTGNNPDNITGIVALDDLSAVPVTSGFSMRLDRLTVTSSLRQEGVGEAGSDRLYVIDSDWLRGNITGHFLPTRIPAIIKSLTGGITGATSGKSVSADASPANDNPHLEFDFRILRDGDWGQYFHLPVSPVTDVVLKGSLDMAERNIHLSLNAPYLRQGRDKLIRNTTLDAGVTDGKGHLTFFSSIPTKKGVLDLDADVTAKGGVIDVGLGFNRIKEGAFYGELSLTAMLTKALNGSGMQVDAHIHPTTIWLNKAGWQIGEANIGYNGKRAEVKGFSIMHDDQYLTIGGIASADPTEEMLVKLNDIDLDYIFDTLAIDYVAFGGFATGEAVGRGLLSGRPEAFTRQLHVKDLSYNHSVLGDGEVRGDFDASSKRVGISAGVTEEGRPVAEIDGGIWIGRDSLAFAIEADKVRVGFLQTFMQAFSSRVEGRASGKANLYGTFKDIDMTGRLFADTISVKVDYTNVVYSGRDSVIIDPGRIHIPSFRLSDQYGHSAKLQGNLTHNYFHDPAFRFTISDASNLLVYDTDATMNPIWYGRIFGSGGGIIEGRPGYVGILADMTTCRNSSFTFVLSDAQEAMEYKFLTFTDHRKEAAEAAARMAEESEPDDIVATFNRSVAGSDPETVLGMDIRATVTPDARLTLVMDPAAGDKITATGSGAMNMTYNSESNDLRMYGKYTLQEGVYNFSLQDLILRDFIIKPGSNISFNGDPMNGLLDIRAAYRVNTSLTELDKSFANDRDLNRTNVPVDAMLVVTGEMTEPDITFDIELPTLNDEVTQKVRSIISSDDMMNRQIIYLLALNRFYPSEYMGNTASGGEWASVASSTLSSQLTNMLGQLTDKVNIAPSVRSDKGDFSDLEVDLALSSRLLNNRLLINGNFGYRDRNSSSTTFIGDFDIEYLLHRNGNLRLKAYNHFNDQNYYLKSALTTQGLGIIYRKDFDRLFHRRKKKPAATP